MHSSLFDAPVEPALGPAGDWLTGALSGSVAISLCVVAVAIIGLMLMTGRLAAREAAKVVIGCFALLGAPVIAAGLHEMADGTNSEIPPISPVAEVTPAPVKRPPANYDPYAGASLRRD